MKISLSQVAVRLPGRSDFLFRVPSLEIASGSKVLIRGASGKGKTTLLHLIAGLFPPTEGEVWVGDKRLNDLDEAELCRLRREHFGIVFQKLNLIDHLTAEENVGLQSLTEAERAEAGDCLARVGLGGRENEITARLSVGEQQRVAVARVFLRKPVVVLADEPTSSLDERNADAILSGLLTSEWPKTVVVVSHDSRIQQRFDRVIDFEKLVE